MRIKLTRLISLIIVMRPPEASTLAIVALIFTSLSSAHHHCSFDFGSCSSPGIQYGYNIDGSQLYGYAPLNGTDFPHGWSPDIATIESFICNRLQSPCNAPPETVQRCQEAFNLYSGLSGDNAVASWNVALGLGADGSDDENGDDDHQCPPMPAPAPAPPGPVSDGWLTTTTTTLYVPAIVIPYTAITYETTTSTQTTQVLSIITKTYTTDTYTYTSPSPTSTLTLTLTLPAGFTTTDRDFLSNTVTYTTTEVTIKTESTDTTTSIAVAETTIPNPSGSDGSNGNNDGGGSPFDSKAPALFSAQVLQGIAMSLALLMLGLAFML